MATGYEVSWKDKDEKKVNHYLAEIMKLATVDDDGRVSFTHILKFHAYQEIITRHINIEGLEHIDTRRALVHKAISRFARYSKHDLLRFRRAMTTERRRYLQRPIVTFHILFPINIRQADLARRRWFNILNSRICCRTWSYVERHYDIQRFLDEAAFALRKDQQELARFLYGDFCPLTIATDARTSAEAFRKASEVFDILRTLMNLTTAFLMVRLYGGRDRPLGQYLPPPVFGIFEEDGSYDLLYFSTERYDYQERSLSEDRIRLVHRLAKRIEQPKDEQDTMRLVIDALRKYGHAMDTADWQVAFLALWQILELVALQTAGYVNMKDVANRIANLLALKENAPERDLLDVAVQSRNDLVHRGRFSEDGLREVNYLKVVVDQVISFLLSPRFRAFPTTKRLRAFYAYATTPATDLRVRGQVIDRILRQRGK